MSNDKDQLNTGAEAPNNGYEYSEHEVYLAATDLIRAVVNGVKGSEMNFLGGQGYPIEDILNLPVTHRNTIYEVRKILALTNPVRPYRTIESLNDYEFPEDVAFDMEKIAFLCANYPNFHGYYIMDQFEILFNTPNKTNISLASDYYSENPRPGFQLAINTGKYWNVHFLANLAEYNYPDSDLTINIYEPEKFYSIMKSSASTLGSKIEEENTSNGFTRFRVSFSFADVKREIYYQPELLQKLEREGRSELYYYIVILGTLEIEGNTFLATAFGGPDQPKDSNPIKAKKGKERWNWGLFGNRRKAGSNA